MEECLQNVICLDFIEVSLSERIELIHPSEGK